MPCTVCNWSKHKRGDHKGEVCKNGHPRDIAGVYETKKGRTCRICQLEAVKRYETKRKAKNDLDAAA